MTICISFILLFLLLVVVVVCMCVQEWKRVERFGFFQSKNFFIPSLCLIHKEMRNMPPALWLLSFVKVTFIVSVVEHDMLFSWDS